MHLSLILLFVLLAGVTLVLAIYLGILAHRLYLHRLEAQRRVQEYEKGMQERQKRIFESLDTLALVAIQDQCPPTEACIRIKRLIDEFSWLKEREDLSVFHQMYDEVKHLAILEDYKKLSKQERFSQDSQRLALEQKYSTRLKQASEKLREILP